MRLLSSFLLEKADPQVACLVDGLAVGLQPSIGRTKYQASAHHALKVDAVLNLFGRRRHHAAELDLARGDGAALAGLAQPSEIEASQLPHGVEAQTTRHDRITDEVAGEEPKIRLDIELSTNEALAEFAASLAHFGDAIEHQHWRRWKLRIALAEQFAPSARQKLFVVVTGLLLRHNSLLTSRPMSQAVSSHLPNTASFREETAQGDNRKETTLQGERSTCY